MLKLSKEKLLEIEKQLGFDKLKDFDIKSKGVYALNNGYTLTIKYNKCDFNSWLGGTMWEYEKIDKQDRYHLNSSMFRFSITGWPSGCGAGFIHNLTMKKINEELSYNLLLYILDKVCIRHGWGAIMTTYGETYRNNLLYKMLLSIGFTELSKYRNIMHGDNYYQYVLQLILKP